LGGASTTALTHWRILLGDVVVVEVRTAERVRVREITNEEGNRLLRIVRRSSGSMVTWRRAQMVLLSAQGMDVAAVAGVAFTSEDRCGRCCTTSTPTATPLPRAIVLHRHDANEREQFAETRTGLDHVGFMVADRQELEAWQMHLDKQGVKRSKAADRPLTQSPIADESYASVLVFRDPDNIRLELFAPPGT
jgi:catechol 2,3-dioxygenase-like lactoylglutathione lyase family enzyme